MSTREIAKPPTIIVPLFEGGVIVLVKGDHEEATARQAALDALRRDRTYLEPDEPDPPLTISEPTLWRMNPCNEDSCFDGGGHRCHVEPVETERGKRGAFLARSVEVEHDPLYWDSGGTREDPEP